MNLRNDKNSKDIKAKKEDSKFLKIYRNVMKMKFKNRNDEFDDSCN